MTTKVTDCMFIRKMVHEKVQWPKIWWPKWQTAHFYKTYSSRNNTNTSNTDARFSSVVKQTFVMACISSLKWSVKGLLSTVTLYTIWYGVKHIYRACAIYYCTAMEVSIESVQCKCAMEVCIGSVQWKCAMEVCNGSVQWKCAMEIRISTKRKWLTLMGFRKKLFRTSNQTVMELVREWHL